MLKCQVWEVLLECWCASCLCCGRVWLYFAGIGGGGDGDVLNAWKPCKRCFCHHRLLFNISLFHCGSHEGSGEAELDVKLHSLGLPLHPLHPQVVHQHQGLHCFLHSLKLNHAASSSDGNWWIMIKRWTDGENHKWWWSLMVMVIRDVFPYQTDELVEKYWMGGGPSQSQGCDLEVGKIMYPKITTLMSKKIENNVYFSKNNVLKSA